MVHVHLCSCAHEMLLLSAAVVCLQLTCFEQPCSLPAHCTVLRHCSRTARQFQFLAASKCTRAAMSLKPTSEGTHRAPEPKGCGLGGDGDANDDGGVKYDRRAKMWGSDPMLQCSVVTNELMCSQLPDLGRSQKELDWRQDGLNHCLVGGTGTVLSAVPEGRASAASHDRGPRCKDCGAGGGDCGPPSTDGEDIVFNSGQNDPKGGWVVHDLWDADDGEVPVVVGVIIPRPRQVPLPPRWCNLSLLLRAWGVPPRPLSATLCLWGSDPFRWVRDSFTEGYNDDPWPMMIPSPCAAWNLTMSNICLLFQSGCFAVDAAQPSCTFLPTCMSAPPGTWHLDTAPRRCERAVGVEKQPKGPNLGT